VTRILTSAAIGSVATQLGVLSFAWTDIGLATVFWGRADELKHQVSLSARRDLSPPRVVATELSEYFSGDRRTFDLPLDWRFTTTTQQTVLQTLYDTVPWGQSITYGELAARSGSGVPARAIGGIMGSNPLPIVVPCHRVVAATGLGGYSGGERSEPDAPRDGLRPHGLETKRWLLTFEEVLPPTLGWDPDARLDLDASRPSIG
jgi:methylated-DNA-[protein]-cysteine S-methyltransferase